MIVGAGLVVLIGFAGRSAAVAPGRATLSGHVPSVVKALAPVGRLAATNVLRLAIGLPLRNQPALDLLLAQIADPASDHYHRYLSAQQFTDLFGPTTNDYQAVIDFANANGLAVTHTHGNRMIVEVAGAASDVEHAFTVTLRRYQHPKEKREFFASDTEPSVPAGLSVLDVTGLSSYARPQPKLRLNSNSSALPKAGSGPGGNYMGYDFRAAYVPGTTLTGAGQKIALVQFDGYLASDIALYAQKAGLPSVALTNILLNGFSGLPTGSGGEVEVSLDIEMVISMAPGLSQVLVYEGDPYNFNPNVVLNRIANDNAAQQVSCSWGWTGGPNATSDQIFLQMALQGQSFFNASGDSDAFLSGQVDDPRDFGFPSCSPYITQVGGTTLTTSGPGGFRVSEKVWNWGGGIGSSGGISDYYATPLWQVGFGTATNHGSATGRNIPDVALTGDNVYVIADNGVDYPGTGGTSCAAPLWAGFMALVNQQAALNGRPPAGFINPAIYALAKNAAYASAFNDITNGNNAWSRSPTNFFAVPGYDLCTGLGTPNGTNLINALAATNASSGPPGVIVSAPRPPYGTTLGVMNGSNPNGPWFLFVQDDSPINAGLIANGWFVTLTTANPVGYAADNQLFVTPSSLSVLTNTLWTVSLAVTNYGPSSSTNVFVTDTLPGSGVTLVSSNVPAGSSLQILGSALTWALGNLPVNAGASLTLNFLAVSPGAYTNDAKVYAVTSDPNPDDDGGTATLLVFSVTPPPVLGGGSFALGSGGFYLTVTNDNGTPTIIQASTNLVDWDNIYTSAPPYLSPFTFTNSDASNYPARFYRAVTGVGP